MNINNYEKFLEIFMQDIDAMFEHQKDFICCHEGCAYCCEYGEYPFTEIEFRYLLEGFNKLDKSTKSVILNNIKKINLDENEYYTCPFLIDKKCTVYKHRAIVCRTFGLLNRESDGRVNGPFCGKLGLNYSKVYDKETKQLLMDVITQNNYKNLPRVFNLNIDNIRNLNLVKELGIQFGQQKSLYSWLKEYLSDSNSQVVE